MTGVRLKHLREGTKKVVVEAYGAKINVVYRPLAMSVADQDEYEAMLKDNDYNGALFAFLPKVLKEWDLMDDAPDDAPYEEIPVEITEEAMRDKVPVEILRKVLMSIMEDLYPNDKKKSSFAAA